MQVIEDTGRESGRFDPAEIKRAEAETDQAWNDLETLRNRISELGFAAQLTEAS